MKKTDGKTTLKHLQALAKTGTKLKTAAARRAEELLALIARRKENIVDAFYDVGQALQEMLDNKLHMALGYDNFEAMIAARNVIGRSQAFKLIAVVKQLPRAEALAMGQERAYALANLAAATPRHDTATSIVTKGVRVRGTVRDVSRLSVREIESLAKQVRPRKSESHRQAPESARPHGDPRAYPPQDLLLRHHPHPPRRPHRATRVSAPPWRELRSPSIHNITRRRAIPALSRSRPKRAWQRARKIEREVGRGLPWRLELCDQATARGAMNDRLPHSRP